MYKVIYYIADANNLNKELKGALKNKVDVFDYELNFSNLINRARTEMPDVIILDYKEYDKGYKQLNIFSDETCINVPVVIIAGYVNPENKLLGPSNYIYVKYDDIPVSIDLLRQRLTKMRNNPIRQKQLEIDNKGLIYKTLIGLGFNAGSMGTNYTNECVSQIMLNKCNPCCFHNTIFSYVSNLYNTTPANVSRCIKVALETAWKHRDKNKNDLPGNITFDDFVRCPTSKEFIYYLANKLTMYIQNLKFNNNSNF